MIYFPFFVVSVLSMSQNIKIVLVCTMTNPKSVLWQLTMFWWAKYNQMTTIFFILAFLLTVELWIRFLKRQ